MGKFRTRRKQALDEKSPNSLVLRFTCKASFGSFSATLISFALIVIFTNLFRYTRKEYGEFWGTKTRAVCVANSTNLLRSARNWADCEYVSFLAMPFCVIFFQIYVKVIFSALFVFCKLFAFC